MLLYNCFTILLILYKSNSYSMCTYVSFIFILFVNLLLQRLRCKCNFHALKFVPKIQEIGSLLVRRIRKHDSRLTELDKQLFGDHRPQTSLRIHHNLTSPAKYLALHMRFEMDMVAYSICDFGGGEEERKELQAYREIHFPTLVMRSRNG